MSTSNNRSVGIYQIYIGNVPNDGATMPDEKDMMLIGHNVKPDSVSLDTEDATFETIKNQEDNSVDLKILTDNGKTTFVFETWDFVNENLINALGGSVVNGKWIEPVESYRGKEVCLRVVTKSGKGLHAVTDFPRVLMNGKINGILTEGEPSSIVYNFEKLTPINASGVKQGAKHIYHKPTAPTNPVTDDSANTFGWDYVEGFETAGLYEYSTDTGANYATCTANPQTGITGGVAIGALLVRIKTNLTGTNPYVAGFTLANTEAFTA